MKPILLSIAFVFASQPLLSAALQPFDQLSSGYVKVPVSDQQNPKGLFSLWKRTKDSQVLCELPKTFVGKSYFIALTVSSGEQFAGLQSGELVVQWRRFDDRLALVLPNLQTRALGDAESKASVKRLFTDRVLLDIPILAMGPGGGPVIDLDSLLVGNSAAFFGGQVRVTNPRITTIKKAKVFPKNVEVAFEIVGAKRQFQTIHYSFSEVPMVTTAFKPRKADARVGYFTTAFTDLSKYKDDETRVRYITRWNLQKRDPKLKLSPPKEPIRFYVEHTAPVRYRRWIKAGVEYWNEAFRKVGIDDAIVVEYQDPTMEFGHMEKDPEDVRYNFIRWLNNNVGTAIGPSRIHPLTGEILDADIILTDGWIRHFNFNFEDLMPKLAMEGADAETLAWLSKNPRWDPRIRLAPPAKANLLRQQILRQSQQPLAGHPMAQADPSLIGDDEFDGLYGNISQRNGYCAASSSRAMELALTRMNWALTLLDEEEEKEKEADEDEDKEEEKAEDDKEEGEKEGDEEGEKKDDDKDKEGEEKEDKKPEAPKADMLDGIPEWFVGPLLADLVAHEVGHTLGLRHNFKASALMDLDEINSEKTKGKRPFAASVMDYIPINYRLDAGNTQGDYAMIDIGPYDFWAIEYGYTFDEKKLPEILKRCSEPELQYATDEDTSGPDPLARRYDFAKDPLDYAEEQMQLVKLYRERILDKFVKDGDSWAEARRGYELTLTMQVRSSSMMANWVGGTFVNRDLKGDPGNRPPVEVVPADQQRKALNFVIETTFKDAAYGLTPKLLERMSIDQWLDIRLAPSTEAAWPIHDRILGIQASAMTSLMNPSTLRRVYDNELRLPEEEDALTLPELLKTINSAVWSEIDKDCPDGRNDRKPMISSLRRNLVLQNEDRAASKPISNLARMELRSLSNRINASIKKCGKKMDPYSLAHLTETKDRIERALEAGYTYNAAAPAPAGGFFFLGKEENQNPTPLQP